MIENQELEDDMDRKHSVRDLLSRIPDESGVMIIEATFIFPVVLFVLFFIIMTGNLYLQIARVDDIVTQAAIRGAKYIVNPKTEEMEETGSVPVEAYRLEPYRYIFGDFSEIEAQITREVRSEIEEGGMNFFAGMEPKVINGGEPVAEYVSHIVYSEFIVEVRYTIQFPIPFWGMEELMEIEASSRAVVSVNDSPEFIRNVDMVVDLVSRTRLGEAISEAFETVNRFIRQFAGS